MNIPKLRQQKTIKKCHGISWEDSYACIHQENILQVIKDPTKLNLEVRKYLEKNNKYTEYHLKDTKKLQKKLFDEIKGRIKLDDESLPYTDKKYIYWTKTTKETNYLRVVLDLIDHNMKIFQNFLNIVVNATIEIFELLLIL